MPVGTITFPTTIDSDQTLSGAANNVTVLLDQAINSSQTTIAVASTTFFPAAGFATIVDNLTTPTKIEIISYTQISGNTLQSVIRGTQGTTPQSFSTGYVEIRPTAGHHLALVDAIVAIENRLGTGSTLSLTKGGTGRAFTTMPGTDRIFFWDASANSMQLLELGTNLSITGTTLNATGGGAPPASFDAISLIMPDMYTVTPGTLTPGVFTTFTVTFNAQQKNKVLAAPTNSTDVPTFRLLTDADIPNALTITQFASVTSNGFVKTTNGDGTLSVDTNTYVTSVGLSLPNIFTVTNSPVTSSGTLTATLATQAENLVLVGPINAPAATPTFRLLEDEDIPNVLSIHKNRHLTTNGFVKTTNGDGTYAVDTSTYLTGNQTVTLSGDVTGSGATAITTTIANGAVTYGKIQNVSATSRVLGRKTAGAGSAEELTFSEVLDFVGSAAQGDILYRGSTGWERLAAGTSGQYLQTQGTAANPQWATVVAGGTPGGSSGQMQFNSAGSFGGATGFTYQSGASPNVTITAQNAAYVALSLVSASTPTIDVFRVSADNGTTTHFAITSTGAPHSPGTGSGSLRYGSGSTAIGAQSVMIGVNAGSNASTGADNVVIGHNANSGRGMEMVIIGRNAGNSNSGYTNTVIIGKDAAKSGGSNAGGTSNSVAIGQNVAYLANYFSNSILIGCYAGGNNSAHNATENVGIGYRAAISISTGSYNAWVGGWGGEGFDTGSYNTGLGYRASYLVGTGSSSTLASTICLGANTFPTASNQCVIGGANANGQINDMYIGSGVTFATPVNVKINASGGSGSNIAGANLTIAGGIHTGTPAFTTPTGHVILSTSTVGAAASTANSLVQRFIVNGARKALTDATDVNLFEVALPSLTGCAGAINFEIFAADATDTQVRRGSVQYSAVNKGGTYTTEIAVVSEAASVSAGTLTATWSILNGTNKITIRVNADTSLTPTTFYCVYTLENNSQQAITVV